MVKITCITVLSLLLLTGCSASILPVGTSEPKKDASSPNVPHIAFEYNNILIEMHAPADPILKRLGEPVRYFEAASCAHEGMDRVYTYPGFELHTYERNDVESVLAVILIDDSISTREGLNMSSPSEDIQSMYGEVPQPTQGVYVYRSSQTTLTILVQDNRIIEIAYMAVFNESR